MAKEWTLEEVQELVSTIRSTVLNIGYFIGLGGDLLGGKGTSNLELIFIPGDPMAIAEAMANGMKNAFVYVNEPNEEKLVEWLDKVWGAKKRTDAADPVISFGDKALSQSGGIMPKYVGIDKNNSHVYVHKLNQARKKKEPKVYEVGGGRTITTKIQPKAPITGKRAA